MYPKVRRIRPATPPARPAGNHTAKRAPSEGSACSPTGSGTIGPAKQAEPSGRTAGSDVPLPIPMKTELAGPDERVERRPPVLPWLVVLFVGAGAIGAWFLIAPALGSGPYYRQVLYRSSYGYNRQILPLFVPYGLALW